MAAETVKQQRRTTIIS